MFFKRSDYGALRICINAALASLVTSFCKIFLIASLSI